MEQQEQQEIELLIDLFNHDGWKLFIKEKEALLTTLKENAYVECHDNSQWQQRRGIIATLAGIISYETSIRFVMEQDEEDYEQE
jgi:hypothetical protein